MAATFHVYVEGPVERSPDAIRRVAAAIAQTYGLQEADLARRLAAGRFRVKANVDRATAELYQRALEECGARVSIEDATTGEASRSTEARQSSAVMPPARSERSARYSVSPPITTGRTVLSESGRAKTPSVPGAQRSQRASAAPATARPASPSSAPARRPSASVLPPATTTRPSSSVLPPATTTRPSSSSLPPATTTRSGASKPPQFQSGLAAAFSGDAAAPADLGALGSGALSLASLDGGDAEPAAAAGSFAPPAAPLPATMGPPAAVVSFTSPAAPQTSPARAEPPVDLFAPPDADAADAIVEIAADELAHRARKESAQPATSAPAGAPGPEPAPTTPVLSQLRKPRASDAPEQRSVVAPELPRARYAAGVFLAILLGFVPAHFFASVREASAFASIDAQVQATQLAADTPETYAALDAFRAAQLERKQSERRTIALTAMAVWALVSAGAAYVWFRRIPWNR